MQLILGYLFTPLYYLWFGLALGLFHPIQVLSWHLGGYEAHKKSVGILNYFLVKGLWILGARIRFEGFELLPKDRPLVVAANHQSIFDIQAFVYGFNAWHPKFVSKIELGKGIPSISYNLRRSGSALIDRSKGSQAIREIVRLGRYVEANNYAVCIYPEGTRSRDGRVKPFQSAGVKSLLKAAPSALLVPFVIEGHSDLMKKGYFPLLFGQKLTYRVLPPLEPGKREAEELVQECELKIKQALGQA